MKIEGNWILVTGASSGLGEAIARKIAEKKGKLILLARNREKLATLAKEFNDMGAMTRYFAVDLSNKAQVKRVTTRISQEVGAPDVIINNAGAGEWKEIETTSFEEAEFMMAVPYFAAFYVTRSFIEEMLERNSGHIVNITSPAAEMSFPGAVAYTAARSAMRGFSDALAADLHRTKINVSLFSAGKISSEYFKNNPGSEERIPRVADVVRTITPEEAAAGVVKCIERNKKYMVMPFMMRMFYLSNRWFPRMNNWLAWRTGWQRKTNA